jgi:hypothetical protein
VLAARDPPYIHQHSPASSLASFSSMSTPNSTSLTQEKKRRPDRIRPASSALLFGIGLCAAVLEAFLKRVARGARQVFLAEEQQCAAGYEPLGADFLDCDPPSRVEHLAPTYRTPKTGHHTVHLGRFARAEASWITNITPYGILPAHSVLWSGSRNRSCSFPRPRFSYSRAHTAHEDLRLPIIRSYVVNGSNAFSVDV